MNNKSASQQADEEASIARAVALHHSGDLAGASEIYQSIYSKSPGNFDAAHLLGIVELQEGRPTNAIELIGAALRLDPDSVAARCNLATAYLQSAQLELALQQAMEANRLAPGTFDILSNLGTILHRMGRYREALTPLREAMSLQLDSPQAANLLGACLLKCGEPNAAEDMFRSATAANPGDYEAWANLAVAQNAIGQHQKAMQSAHQSLSLRPMATNALGALAIAQFEMGQLEDAISTFRTAVTIQPSPILLCEFAQALLTSGLHADALVEIEKAMALDQNDPVARWLFTMAQVMPMLENQGEIDKSRAKFLEHLDGMQRWYRQSKPVEAFRAVGSTQPFYLAYQPFNNRELLRRYGEACVEWMQSLPVTLPPVRRSRAQATKIKVGFASTHIRNHSVWVAVTRGFVEHLNPRRFDSFLFHLGLQSDKETESARKTAHHFEEEPTDLFGWIDAIKRAELDVLIYPAIGMDALTTQLAALRLAPVQATTWGHPETSGLSTIDYYLSGEHLEPTNGQDNYNEQLIRLPNLGATIQPLKPKVFHPNLESMGLPKDEPLLLCAGSPFKYSPLFDWVWIEIARGLAKIGSGQLVFFAGVTGAMYQALQDRLRTNFAKAGIDFDSRAKIVPQLERPRFFGLMERASLMLDTLGFSGFNTAIQAIECGLPILTFEGEFMRGRLASCFMRSMNVPDLIARSPEEFVERALLLSKDHAWRKQLAKEIGKRRRILFDDLRPVRSLEAHLEAWAS